jgi:hypothetical protein
VAVAYIGPDVSNGSTHARSTTPEERVPRK